MIQQKLTCKLGPYLHGKPATPLITFGLLVSHELTIVPYQKDQEWQNIYGKPSSILQNAFLTAIDMTESTILTLHNK